MKESFQKPNKSLRNLKMAALVSLGLIAGGKGEAQTVLDNSSNSKRIEVNETAESAIKNLETTLKTFHLGDQFSEYEKQIDTIISQRITLNEEQLQRIISAIPEFVRSLNKQAKNKSDNKKVDEVMNKLLPIDRKLLDYIYQGDKSPFAELDGPLAYNFEKGIDASIPDIEGRKLFNLVFNKQFKYDSVENKFVEKNSKNEILEGNFDLYKADETVIVRLMLNDGAVGMFWVTIRTKD